ncbi:phosphotransferase [Rhodococcus wratislaviensis]|uniref:phosphotransferase n=1 Tax=Rhodococcus wratislaviensis TaxID=44752 RepID=UPI003651FAEA
MMSTNRLHALTTPDEVPEMCQFDSLMASSGLTAPTSPLDEQTVLTALGEFFRLAGTLTRIPTEKDDTFVLNGNQDRLLVKISGAQEAPSVVNLQTAVLLHIAEAAPTLPIPTVLHGTDGEYEYDLAQADAATARVLRVMKFLPGSALSDSHPTREQISAVGRAQAAITDALTGFTHPQQDRILVWNLRYFPILRPLLEEVADPEDRMLGERIFDAYAECVQGRIPQLRHQVVHGDFSAHNVLVDGSHPEYVSGIIDFGDTTRTAEIFDVAIAMSNQLDADADDPWHRALGLLSGYATRRMLDDSELSLLPIAVASRSLQRALIARWRAQQDPSRADYVLSHAAHDWTVLRSIGTTWSPVVDCIYSINESLST